MPAASGPLPRRQLFPLGSHGARAARSHERGHEHERVVEVVMVPEQRVRTYQVCRMVPEQHVRTCCYRVCRIVREDRCCEQCYRVCTMVREKCTKLVPMCVTKPVHFTKTVEVCRLVPKQVPCTVIRCVPKVVCRKVDCDPDCSAEPGCAAEPACGCDE